jgi:cytidylate kinase
MSAKARSIVAIDGPAGAGKSTVARRLASLLGWRFLDTGAFYRAVTLKALAAGVEPADAEAVGRLAEVARIEMREEAGVQKVFLDGVDVTREIRGPDVSKSVPVVAAHADVRRAIVPQQRAFAAAGRVVAEGREWEPSSPGRRREVLSRRDDSVRAARRAAERGDADAAGSDRGNASATGRTRRGRTPR